MNDGYGFYDDFDKTSRITLPPTNNKKKNKNKKKKKKGGKAKRIILTICIVFVVVTVAGLGLGMAFLNGFSNGDIPEAVEPEEKGIVNIMLVGKDIGTVGEGDVESTKRTDTIMLINYNLETNEVNVVSVPRDTLVYDENGYECKINSLYQYGVDTLKGEVEEILGVSINYIIELDYKAFREFIDAIGGVEVTPEYDMHYDDHSQDLSIHFNAGETVQLDGQSAEEFFRWRKNNDGTSVGDGTDISRIGHQQKFLMEVFKKCTSPEIVTKIPDIIKIMQSNITTNMNAKTILKYATSVVSISSDKINMYTLEGEFYDPKDEYGNSVSYWKYLPEKNIEMLCNINPNLDPLTFKKEAAKIIVLNATGIPGLAAQVQEELTGAGYLNVEAGNAYSNIETSSVESLDNDILTDISSVTGISNKLNTITDGYDCDVIVTIGLDHPLVNEGASDIDDTTE